MSLFKFDSVNLCYSNVEEATRWWIKVFDCKQVPVPADWDEPHPSDVALQTPGASEPAILLSDKNEAQDEPTTVPVVFCSSLQKALTHFSGRGVAAGPIQDGGDCQFFEIRDPEGHVIETSTEP